MWCEKCQADVAVAAAADKDRSLCAVCGSVLEPSVSGKAAFGALDLKQPPNDPRELLARWAREDALGSLDAESLPVIPRTSPVRPALRFDGAHAAAPAAQPHIEANPQPAANPVPVKPLPEKHDQPAAVHYAHPAHGVNAPHIPVAPALAPVPDRGTRWVALAGQLFAYFGVGGLTVGTVLVLIGYFGGPGSYATTGWLVATAGQMLLFLGVVTLVSGGMEQTTHEVARRIDTLGERLERIELAARGSGGAGPAEPSEVGEKR